MLARYQKSIYKLVALLRRIQLDPEDLDTLLQIQREIITRIRRTDKRIADLKALKRHLIGEKKRGGVSKADARFIKESIVEVSGAVTFYQWLLFVWRSFGDSIAFVYLDKFSIKHMIFNVDDGAKKEAPGAIVGKEGFGHEWRLVRSMARKKIPAMLCDISNVLRHGDVCVLVGPDPIPIEVKTSENSNARVERQFESLKKIRSFYDTDNVTNFRGHETVQRVELPAPKINHAATINECIARSKETGGAAISPEAGLVYACLRTASIDEILMPHVNPSCAVVMLNRAKAEGEWNIFVPFLLSIDSGEAIFEFLNGDISLFVVADMDELVRTYAVHGLCAEHTATGLLVSRLDAQPGKHAFVTTSPVFLSRIFYEFESIDALASMQASHIELIEARSSSRTTT
ncbi:hypothetical protein BG24_3084 [Burkholderia pseudomallei PB08298010]|nr:hypothetical protein BG24_3084 [Burkholderia pseudomallei PB08298010]